MVPGCGQEALALTRFGTQSQDSTSLIKWEQFYSKSSERTALLCYVRQGDASLVPQRSASSQQVSVTRFGLFGK